MYIKKILYKKSSLKLYITDVEKENNRVKSVKVTFNQLTIYITLSHLPAIIL